MKKYLILIIGLFVCSSAFGQSDWTGTAQEIRLNADTVTSIIISESPNALMTNIVVCNDTTVTDTLEFYKITNYGDTLGLTLRLCEDWSGTSDISIRTVVPASTCREYFIVNPVAMRKIFVRVKGILTASMTNGIQYRIYLLKNKLAP